jgi:hypothetical protein
VSVVLARQIRGPRYLANAESGRRPDSSGMASKSDHARSPY